MDPAGQDRRAFVFDGSMIRTAHTPESRAADPPGSNQYGEGHWSMIRALVAHDVHTGSAMRPHRDPMHGPHAVSEQGLLEQAIDQLPSGSTAMGDANFGVFSVAYTATERQHPVLLRLTPDRCRRLAGSVAGRHRSRGGLEACRADRQSHPDPPADACVSGRLTVRQVRAGRRLRSIFVGPFHYLAIRGGLPTLRQRWAIETDPRTLKSTLCLEQLTCLTPETVAKEIEVAIAACHPIRR